MISNLLLALLLAPAAPIQDGFLLAEGQHVHGMCWFRAERAGEDLAEELRDVGEAAWAAAAPWVGAPSDDLESPFIINAYQKRKGFVSAVEGTEPGAALDRAGWGHWPSRQVHLKLQPIFQERVFLDLGLPPISLRLAAREVAHMARLEGSGGQDLAPRWFAEGLAQWAAQQSLVARGRAAGGLDDPAWSTHFVRVRGLQRLGLLPLVADLLVDQPGELEDVDRTALHAVFFTFLTGREEWLPRGPRLAAGWTGEALLAEVDVDELELGFLGWLVGQVPTWEEQTPAMAAHQGAWMQTPVRGVTSLCWSDQAPPAGDYVVRGEYLAYRDQNGMAQVNIALGRQGGDYISVSFNTSAGIHAWSYSAERDAAGEPPFTEVTSKVPEHPLTARTWMPFSVTVKDERVFIEVGPNKLRPFDTTGRPMGGQWGLGTFKGCIGLWRNVECIALED